MADSVLIVGGGLVGLGVAWRCLQAGFGVTVLDAGRMGGEASWASAGMLAPRMEADFENGSMLRLSLASQALWPAFAAELTQASGIDLAYDATGTLLVSLNRDDELEVARWASFAWSHGLEVERWERDRCLAEEPALSSRVRSALACRADHQVCNRRLVSALIAAVERAGGELRPSSAVAEVLAVAGEVQGVVLASGERVAGTQVVVAAGAWCRSVGGLAPMCPPIRPVKGQALALEFASDLPPPRWVIRGIRGYLVPKPERIVVGATTEERGYDRKVTAEAVHQLLEEARDLVPSTGHMAIQEMWAGFRPAGRDEGPYVGSGGLRGLHFATGHYRHGVLLLPVTARAMADSMRGTPLPDVFAPFGPLRHRAVSGGGP